MNQIMPIYGENYDLHWQAVNFYGKRILDVGADIGSTASYFLRKGASLVYAVEGNMDFYRALERNSQLESKIIPIFLFIKDAQSWSELLQLEPDIVKVDCEGCEQYLLTLSDDTFSAVPEWIIEVHSDPLFKALMEKLRKNNYVTSFYQYSNRGPIVNICVAWKRS